MPGKLLPTFAVADVETHNSAKSCYVTLGSKVFDVTAFVDDHPGGGDLILEHAGQDVAAAMRDEISHAHTEAAYEILDEYHIGFVEPSPSSSSDAARIAAKKKDVGAVGAGGFAAPATPHPATGMSREEDLLVETDFAKDYQTHKFLDLNRPLLMQLWNSGFSKEFYLEQIHRPRHYRGGDSAPLFGNFLEPLSKTAWYVVPSLWLPFVAYGTVVGFAGLGNPPVAVAYWLTGLFLWTLIEYLLHRFLFHIDKCVDCRFALPVFC